MEGDADGKITHELHPAVVGVGTEIQPLAKAQPLRVCEGFQTGIDMTGILFSQRCDEFTGTIRALRFQRPLIPCEVRTMDFHEELEQAVIRQPRRVTVAKYLEICIKGGIGLSVETCEGDLQ